MLATATVNTVWDYFPAYIIASLAALAISLMLVFTILLKMRRTKEMNQFREQFQKMDEMSNKNPLLGHALQFKNNSKTLLDFVQKESLSKKTFSFSLPCSPPFFMTADPEINQRLLLTGLKEGIYQKPALGKRHMRELFGHGIFLSDGKEWQRLRGIANPLFHKASIQSYVPLFVENSIKLVEVFKAKAAEAPENGIDLQNYFLRYTLDTFCEIGFGVQLNSISDGEEANRFFEALEYISDHGEKRMKTGELWRVKEFFIKDQKFIESVKYLDEFIFKIIDDRRNESKEDLALKTDLLSQLMSQGSLSEKELRDWVVNLIIAGRDTTALLLTWCIFELCQDKGSNIKNKIFEEICENLDISPSDFNSEKFSPEFILNNINFEFQKKQRYLHKVFQETLRLYPPVPINGYEALRDDVIKTSDNKKYFVKKGTICVFSPWVTQRHPDNFEDPESFNPDRFDRPVKPFSFLSFNAGPRICLGQEMAYIEAKILFTCLFSQFEFEIRNVDDVKPKQSIILTAENGLYVNIKPRI